MATKTQVHPQGYHRYGFGQFVPYVSFKAKQFAPLSKKLDTETSTSNQNTRAGLSLPQVSVRKLYNPHKHRRRKKLSKSCDNALLCSKPVDHFSRRLPVHSTAAVAGKRTNIGAKNDRVVENGTPWWKWSRKEYHVKPTSFKNKNSLGQQHHLDEPPATHSQRANIYSNRLPSISSKGIVIYQKTRASHHSVLPVMNRPLYTHSEYHPAYYGTILHPSHLERHKDTYYNSNGSLTAQYSSITHSNIDSLHDSVLYDKALKMRYYYSRSRSGIRPVIPGRPPRKVNSLYLVDFNTGDQNSSLSFPSRVSRRKLYPWHLTDPTSIPSEQATARDTRLHPLQQDLKSSQRHNKVLMIPRYTIDSSILDANDNDAGGVGNEGRSFHQSRKLLESRRRVRDLQIELLDEMIALLEKSNYTCTGSTTSLDSYLDSREATPERKGAHFAITNLMDFFEMPEAELKKYDKLMKSKMLERSHKMHNLGTGNVSKENNVNTDSTRTQQHSLLGINSLLTSQEELTVTQNAFRISSNLARLQELSRKIRNGLISENEDLKTVMKQFGLPESLAANVSKLLQNSKQRRNPASDSRDTRHREKRHNPFPDMVINGETFKSLQEMLLLRELEKKMARNARGRGQDSEKTGNDHLLGINRDLSTLEEESFEHYQDDESLEAYGLSMPHGDDGNYEEVFDEDVIEALENEQLTNEHHHLFEPMIDPAYFKKIVQTDLNEKLQMHQLEQETLVLQSVKDDLKYLKDTLNGKLPPSLDKTPEQSELDSDKDGNATGEDGCNNDGSFSEHSSEVPASLAAEMGQGSLDSGDTTDSRTNTANGLDSQGASMIEITCDTEHVEQLSDLEEEDETTSNVFETSQDDAANDSAFLAVPALTTSTQDPSSLDDNSSNRKKSSSSRRKGSDIQPGHKNTLKKRSSSFYMQSNKTSSGNATSLRRASIAVPGGDSRYYYGTPPAPSWSRQGSGLPRSGVHGGRLRTPGTPEFKTAMMQDIGEISAVVNTIRDMVGPLEISRPMTVKGLDTEQRSSTSKTGRRSGVSTRGASRDTSHQRRSLLSSAEERSSPEEVKEIDHERRLRQKKLRQMEWELQQSFEVEKIEIMQRRKKLQQARHDTEERELEKQKEVSELEQQELLKLVQEKEKHLLHLERLKQEEEMRQCLQLYEQAALEEYDYTCSVWNDIDYAHITYYFGEGYSKRQREIERALELQRLREMEESFLEALNLKRGELLCKLKAAQEEFMKGLEVESEAVNHLLQFSKAFVYSYFNAVPSQTYRVPEEAK